MFASGRRMFAATAAVAVSLGLVGIAIVWSGAHGGHWWQRRDILAIAGVTITMGAAFWWLALRLEAANRAFARERDRERVARQRAEALRRAAQTLADANTADEIGGALVDDVVPALDALGALFLLTRDGTGLDLIAESGGLSLAPSYGHVSIDSTTIVAEAVRSRSPVAVPSLADCRVRYPHAVEHLEATGASSVVCAPIEAAGRPIGAISIARRDARPLDDVTVAFYVALAELCGQAFERATFRSRERARRERSETLQRVGDRLAPALTEADVLAVFTDVVLEAFPRASLCLLGTRDGDRIRYLPMGRVPLAALGEDVATLDAPLPLAESTRSGQAIWVETRSEFESRYPVAARLHPEDQTIATAPIVGDRGTLGAVSVSFDHEERLLGSTRRLLIELGERCGRALERARLYEAEARARGRAERLADLAAELSELRPTMEIAEVVAQEAAEGLNVTCVCVGRIADDGGLEILSWRGEDATEMLALLSERDPDLIAALRPGPPSVFDRGTGTRPRQIAVVGVATAGTTGAILVGRALHVAVDVADLRFLSALANHFAQAVERGRLHAVEREARDAQARGRVRAEYLATLGPVLYDAGGSAERMRRLVEVLVPRVADFAVVEVGETGRQWTATVAHIDPAAGSAMVATSAWKPSAQRPAVLGAAESRLTTGEHESGAHSQISVPLLASNRALGTLVLGLIDPVRHPYDNNDVTFAEEIARRAGIAFEEARLYEREHEVATLLQESMLPSCLPVLAGLSSASRYRAGHRQLEVGGDWYDLVARDDGRVAIIVGDVVGRGLSAAAAMGQLRSALSALALSGSSPAAILQRLEGFAESVPGASFASVCIAILDPATGDLVYACAGHPPPLVVRESGECDYLWDGRSAPLCAFGRKRRENGAARVAPGSRLVLYTDGLIERRRASLDAGFELLTDVARDHASMALEPFLDSVLDAMLRGETATDDIAILCVERIRVRARTLHRRAPARPEKVGELRRLTRDWLAGQGLGHDDVFDIVLACGEALANAAEHAYGGGSAGEMEIDAARDPDDGDIVVRVRDFGHWRSPSAPGERGRGRMMMEQLMDSVDMQTDVDGTTVTMRHRVQPVGAST